MVRPSHKIRKQQDNNTQTTQTAMKLASDSLVNLILVATVLGACATTPTRVPPPHINEWIQRPRTNHLYMALDTDGMDWKKARKYANRLSVCGSSVHLATIKTQDEDNFIIDSLIQESDENFWIGGFKKPSQIVWQPGEGYGNGWEWITGGDIPDNQDRSYPEQTSGVDGNGNYENWYDPTEPNNAEGDGLEDCLEFKGFEIAPVKAWNDVACGVSHRFSLVESTVPAIHIGTCDTHVADIVHADFTGECTYEFQDAYEDCVENCSTRGSSNKCIAEAIKTLPKQDRDKVMKVIKDGCST